MSVASTIVSVLVSFDIVLHVTSHLRSPVTFPNNFSEMQPMSGMLGVACAGFDHRSYSHIL